jgi:hypothetical protein
MIQIKHYRPAGRFSGSAVHDRVTMAVRDDNGPEHVMLPLRPLKGAAEFLGTSGL